MNRFSSAAAWGASAALYLGFGLEPTGWFFYQATHWTGIDWLYWGYAGFRTAGHAFGLWDHQLWACMTAGVVIAAISFTRSRMREAG
ncbi:MAG: hypothetical protein VCB25_06105 [Myxococcota bacterium]